MKINITSTNKVICDRLKSDEKDKLITIHSNI